MDPKASVLPTTPQRITSKVLPSDVSESYDPSATIGCRILAGLSVKLSHVISWAAKGAVSAYFFLLLLVYFFYEALLAALQCSHGAEVSTYLNHKITHNACMG